MPINNPTSPRHPDLLLLDYASAGHKDFAGTLVPNGFSQTQHMSASVVVDKTLVQNPSAAPAPASQSVQVYVDASGLTPNQVITWNAVLGDGSQAIIASVII